jgi:hypothetical protein
LQEATPGRADDLPGGASNLFKRATPVQKPGSAAVSEPAKQQDKAPMRVAVEEPSPTPLVLAQRLLSPVVSPLETTGMVLVVAIFILLQREPCCYGPS